MSRIWITDVSAPSKVQKQHSFSFTWTVWYLKLSFRRFKLSLAVNDTTYTEPLGAYGNETSRWIFGRKKYTCHMNDGFDEAGGHTIKIIASLIG